MADSGTSPPGPCTVPLSARSEPRGPGAWRTEAAVSRREFGSTQRQAFPGTAGGGTRRSRAAHSTEAAAPPSWVWTGQDSADQAGSPHRVRRRAGSGCLGVGEEKRRAIRAGRVCPSVRDAVSRALLDRRPETCGFVLPS